MRKGYSIIEVLVAVSILAIALPGLIKWVTASRQTQVGSFRSEQAAVLAQRTLDSLAQLSRASRAPVAAQDITFNGATYTLSWNYLAGSEAASYASNKPGQALVQFDWKVGQVKRTTRLLGVLP